MKIKLFFIFTSYNKHIQHHNCKKHVHPKLTCVLIISIKQLNLVNKLKNLKLLTFLENTHFGQLLPQNQYVSFKLS